MSESTLHETAPCSQTSTDAAVSITEMQRPNPSRPQVDNIPERKVEALLLFGEARGGHHPQRHYPSFQELAVRFGVSHSIVARIKNKYQCLERRKQIETLIDAQVERRLRMWGIATRRQDWLTHQELRDMVNGLLVVASQQINEGVIKITNIEEFECVARLLLDLHDRLR